MTIIEIMVASSVMLIVVTAALMALTSSMQAGTVAALHTTAMCLCQQRLEEVRAVPFADVSEDRFPKETGLVLREGEGGRPVTADRRVRVTDESQAFLNAKRVVVTVSWQFMNQNSEERLETIIHER